MSASSLSVLPIVDRFKSWHPRHPKTRGKIERWHLTLKNRILRENYYLPGDFEAQIVRFVEH